MTLHLGNGASACAVRGGRSVATSMGPLSPLPGLVMGTRSGDLDPAVIFHLHRVGGLSLDEVDAPLNRHGGLLDGWQTTTCAPSSHRREAGDEAAALAFDVYCQRIRLLRGVLPRSNSAGWTRIVFTASASAKTRHWVRRARWPVSNISA